MPAMSNAGTTTESPRDRATRDGRGVEARRLVRSIEADGGGDETRREARETRGTRGAVTERERKTRKEKGNGEKRGLKGCNEGWIGEDNRRREIRKGEEGEGELTEEKGRDSGRREG